MDEIMQMLSEMHVPFAYDHFEEGHAPDPPFLIFLTPESRNFAADGLVYFLVSGWNVELYTDKKEPEVEKAVEAVLSAHGLFFDKTEVYIDSEHLYEVLYSFELKGE